MARALTGRRLSEIQHGRGAPPTPEEQAAVDEWRTQSAPMFDAVAKAIAPTVATMDKSRPAMVAAVEAIQRSPVVRYTAARERLDDRRVRTTTPRRGPSRERRPSGRRVAGAVSTRAGPERPRSSDDDEADLAGLLEVIARIDPENAVAGPITRALEARIRRLLRDEEQAA